MTLLLFPLPNIVRSRKTRARVKAHLLPDFGRVCLGVLYGNANVISRWSSIHGMTAYLMIIGYQGHKAVEMKLLPDLSIYMSSVQ